MPKSHANPTFSSTMRGGSSSILARLALLVPAACVVAIDNGLGLTPPMGWRSYNAFGGKPTQKIMMTMMDALVDTSR